jgi:transposase
MIREAIRRQFKVSLSEVSVARLMKRLGFTPQRTFYRAWQQDAALVERWQSDDYTRTAARAKRKGALIFFADESGVPSDHYTRTSGAPRAATPVVKATGARYGFNLLPAVSARGHFRFMVAEGRVSATVFRDFLARLIVGVPKKLFLIVDGHPTHKAKRVKQFVPAHADRLELFFLPPYAPHLISRELAWAHLKHRLGRAPPQTNTELKQHAIAVLGRLQKLPHLIAGFFHARSCAYTAR